MAKTEGTSQSKAEFAWLHLTVTPELKAALKARALEEGKTQTALVIRALEEYLEKKK